jgi:hypothetical protein
VKFKGEIKMEYEFGLFELDNETMFGVGALLTGKTRKLYGIYIYQWCLGLEVSQ